MGPGLTENGDKAFISENKCLDMFTRITRNAPVEDYLNCFKLAWKENKETAIKILFNLRDIRKGKGEKLIPIVLLVFLKLNLDSSTYEDIIKLLLQYGCWKDILRIMEIYCHYTILSRNPLGSDPKSIPQRVNKKICQQGRIGNKTIQRSIRKDLELILDQPLSDKKIAISLCGKWAPSEKTHFDHFPLFFAKQIMKEMNLTRKEYRQSLSKLRNHLCILERLMATHQFDKIDFSNFRQSV